MHQILPKSESLLVDEYPCIGKAKEGHTSCLYLVSITVHGAGVYFIGATWDGPNYR